MQYNYFNALSDERKKQALSSGVGMRLLHSGLEFAVPLWWIAEDQANGLQLRNGSAFLTNYGHGVFAVTAAHVLAAYIAAKDNADKIVSQLGSLQSDPEARLITNSTSPRSA